MLAFIFASQKICLQIQIIPWIPLNLDLKFYLPTKHRFYEGYNQLSRTEKGLSFHPTCKLTIQLATVLCNKICHADKRHQILGSKRTLSLTTQQAARVSAYLSQFPKGNVKGWMTSPYTMGCIEEETFYSTIQDSASWSKN